MDDIKYISKIVILNNEYEIKDEELRKDIEKLLGPIEVQSDELTADDQGV